ncbi:MAG: N-acetylglucosamine-6-phosphate deacetylase [Caldicoprobacterales bacterium]|jgi:N-acetylglucosamine-6-phosphate deacetylase|nr:amidohydrolase family protein [Clostridiales bacterium]
MKAFVNGKIVTSDKVIDNGVLITQKDRILTVIDCKHERAEIPEQAEIVDAEGFYIAPGFVDIHCHGGGEKYFFQDPERARLHHLRGGTTSVCATLGYTYSHEETLEYAKIIIEACKKKGTNLAGIHFEGPYINPKFGSNSHLTRPINSSEYEELYELAKGYIRQWMISPELEGASEYADFILSKGIALALGHTGASPDTIYEFVDKGASIITHLYDAMGCHLGNESVKITGIIQDTVSDAVLAVGDRVYCEIIADSLAIHVKPANLKLVYRCIGPERTILITDSTIARLDQSGFGKDDIRSAPDLNFNLSGGLSGSKLTMEMAARNFVKYTGATIPEIVKMASENPAKAVGIYDEAGSLEPGKLANIILFDDELKIHKVYLRGNLEVEK